MSDSLDSSDDECNDFRSNIVINTVLEAMNGEKLIVGTKQVLRMMTEDKIEKIIVAKDIDDKLMRKLKKACASNEVQVGYVDTMKYLGELCGIEVGAACAGVVKE